MENEKMNDYICRQAAIDALGERPLNWDDDEFTWGLVAQFDADRRMLEAVPSADVVEVVRCKDCKWGRWDIFDRGMYCGRKNVTLDTHEDDYCSYGERMDGEQHE